MARPQCKGCHAIIRWITTPTGKPMPVDPERLSEWVTETDATLSAKKITLVTPEGRLVTGYQGSVLTPGARQIDGYVPHWATCPQAKAFKTRKEPSHD